MSLFSDRQKNTIKRSNQVIYADSVALTLQGDQTYTKDCIFDEIDVRVFDHDMERIERKSIISIFTDDLGRKPRTGDTFVRDSVTYVIDTLVKEDFAEVRYTYMEQGAV